MIHINKLSDTTEEFLKEYTEINLMGGRDIANLVEAVVVLTTDATNCEAKDIAHPTYNAGIANFHKFANLPKEAIKAGVKEMEMLKNNGAILEFSKSDIVTIAQYTRSDGLNFLLENNVRFNELGQYSMYDILMSAGKESISILQQGGADLNKMVILDTHYLNQIALAQGTEIICELNTFNADIALKYFGNIDTMNEICN